MFDNIGGKMKTLAKVVCWIGIIASCLCGIILIGIDEDTALTGFLVLIFGSLSSWIGSFMTYGLGQLIENSDILVEIAQRSSLSPTPKAKTVSSNKTTDKKEPTQVIGETSQLAAGKEGKCDICGKQGMVYRAHIPDMPYGYNLCEECIKKEKASVDATVSST